jgi:DHA1 family multidrug resistance protein-like MFS transporter
VLGKKIDKPGAMKYLIIASFLSGLMFSIQYFINDLYLLFFVNIVLGFTYGIITPMVFATISKNSDNVRKGGIMGIASSFQFFGNMVGPVLSGYLVGWVSLRFSFIISGIIVALIAILAIQFVRNSGEGKIA